MQASYLNRHRKLNRFDGPKINDLPAKKFNLSLEGYWRVEFWRRKSREDGLFSVALKPFEGSTANSQPTIPLLCNNRLQEIWKTSKMESWSKTTATNV